MAKIKTKKTTKTNAAKVVKSTKVKKKLAAKSAVASLDQSAMTEAEDVQGAQPAIGHGTRHTGTKLPPVGTVIEKRDRHGTLRCKCSVEDGGIRYNKKLYPSISAAAMAAAQVLGLKNKTQNGFVFWGLVKPRRPAANLDEAIDRAWERYNKALNARVQGSFDDGAMRVAFGNVLRSHAEQIDRYREQAA